MGLSGRALRPVTSTLPRRLLVAATLAASLAVAGEGAAGEPSAPPSLMRDLAARGLHDLGDERWNASGQLTGIASWHPGFPARYTDLRGSPNSLAPHPAWSFTGTATLYLGARLWRGGEVYLAPEVISESPFSGLHGLGGAIQNFELQKTGNESPTAYVSRAYLRQTFGLGGGAVPVASDALQLGGRVDRRRVVVTVGRFSVLDVLDRNAFTSDPRRQFLSMAFMTHAAWDFAADARGYAWGGVAELVWDAWAVRLARMSPPREPNQLALDLHLDRRHGDALEVERRYAVLGRDGAVRLLGFANRAVMGRFQDAVAAWRADPGRNAAACRGFSYGSSNAAAPDLCWVRGPRVKRGVGVDVEQQVGADVGLFLRALWADGQSEVQAYTPADRSASAGALATGGAWGRPRDVAGAALGASWISTPHAEYLALGGVDGFVGDGALRRGAEVEAEILYAVGVLPGVWVTADYQRVWNPGFNADRGPVDVLGARIHAQY